MVLEHERIFISKLLGRKKYWSLTDILCNYVMTYPFDFPISSFILSNIGNMNEERTISDILQEKDKICGAIEKSVYYRGSSVQDVFKFFCHSPYNSLLKTIIALRTLMLYLEFENKDSITFHEDGNGEYWIVCIFHYKTLIFNSGTQDRRVIVSDTDKYNSIGQWTTIDEILSQMEFYYSIILFDKERYPYDNTYYDLMFDWFMYQTLDQGKMININSIFDSYKMSKYIVQNSIEEKVSPLYDSLNEQEKKQLEELIG